MSGEDTVISSAGIAIGSVEKWYDCVTRGVNHSIKKFRARPKSDGLPVQDFRTRSAAESYLQACARPKETEA